MSDDNSASQTWQSETGWNGPESGISGGDDTTDSKIAVLWREADGTEGSSFTFDHSGTDDLIGWVLRISGANTTSPFNVKGSIDHTDGSSHVITGVTTTADNCLAFYYLHIETADGDPFSVSGTGWSESDEGDSGNSGAQGAGCWGTKSMASQGATGNATVTSNASDNSTAAIFAIVEEAGGDFTLDAGAGAYTVSGQAVGLEFGALLDAQAGSYTVAGQDVGLVVSMLIAAEGGSYVVTGQSVNLTLAALLNAEAGFYVVAGQAVGLELSALLNAEAGAIVVSGQDVGLVLDALINAERGS
jgi:hypothetical protein